MIYLGLQRTLINNSMKDAEHFLPSVNYLNTLLKVMYLSMLAICWIAD